MIKKISILIILLTGLYPASIQAQDTTQTAAVPEAGNKLDADNPTKAQQVGTLAYSYFVKHKWRECSQYAEQAADIFKAQEGGNSQLYLFYKDMLGLCRENILLEYTVRIMQGMSDSVSQVFDGLLAKVEKTAGEGDYVNAEASLKEMERIYGELTETEKESLNILMLRAYTAVSDFSAAADICYKDMERYERIGAKYSSLYLETASWLSSLLSFKGEYQDAMKVVNSVLNAKHLADSVQLSFISEKAFLLYQMGDYEWSNRFAGIVLNNTDDDRQKNDILSLISGNYLCEADIRASDPTEASDADREELDEAFLKYAQMYHDHSVETFGLRSVEAIDAQIRLAAAYYSSNDDEEMLRIAHECERNIMDVIKDNGLRRTYLESLVPYYIKAGDFAKAKSLVDVSVFDDEKAMPIEKMATLLYLADAEAGLGRVKEAQESYLTMARMLMNETSSAMSSISTGSRLLYWRGYRHMLLNSGRYATDNGSQTEYAGSIYDLALYAKILLINSENNFKKAVKESGDSSLVSDMERLIEMRSILARRQKDMPGDFVALHKYADDLEADIISRTKNPMAGASDNPTWQGIRGALTDNAIAVEMIEYKDAEDRFAYGAVILRKDWKYPVFTPIGDKRTVESLLSGGPLSAEQAESAWNFLIPYLEGVGRVYFSPTGVYHISPVEYPVGESGILSEIEFCRVSSTSELVKKHGDARKGAAVYGGLHYNTTTENTKSRNQHITASADRGSSTLIELEGSAKEAAEIAECFNSLPGEHAEAYLGKEGTEDSFKALDSQGLRVLHIATHGFYDSSTEKRGILHQDMEDHALARSGLFMAGCENPDSVKIALGSHEDGILTASEIAVMDLDGMDLVALSACDTGRGKVTGDGVFGLQRGFKKAGVRSILMSLWNVDDNATRLFMTEFYRRWLEGDSKHDALTKAQDLLKNNADFSDPSHWTAFVLLDGID